MSSTRICFALCSVLSSLYDQQLVYWSYRWLIWDNSSNRSDRSTTDYALNSTRNPETSLIWAKRRTLPRWHLLLMAKNVNRIEECDALIPDPCQETVFNCSPHAVCSLWFVCRCCCEFGSTRTCFFLFESKSVNALIAYFNAINNLNGSIKRHTLNTTQFIRVSFEWFIL